MRIHRMAVGALGLFALAMPAFAADMPTDACKLLPESAIERVQGSKPTSARPTAHDDGRLATTQCFFTLQPFADSISLEVISRSPKGHDDVREFWNERFHGKHDEDEREEEGKRETKKPPEPVKGLGDEAYWVDTGRGGALYVLKGEHLLRLSTGGNLGAEKKIEKLSTLAKEALQRMRNS